MFSVTVSVVPIVDVGVFLLEDNEAYRFPGGVVKAGQETIQFAAVRYVKEHLGITLKKESLIPVDFRSDPERSISKNEIDIGFVCMPNDITPDYTFNRGMAKWESADFEKRCLTRKINLFMDHAILLDRALEVICLMKE